MYDEIFKNGFSNHTNFSHNTGKFDSHFIVNSLFIYLFIYFFSYLFIY